MALIDYTPVKDEAFYELLWGDGSLNEGIRAWFAEHGVDADIVPLDSPIELDTETNEWRFVLYRTNEHGVKYIDPETDDVPTIVVRREFKSLPPWATPAAESVGATA